MAGVAGAQPPLRIKLATLAPAETLFHRVLLEIGQEWKQAQGEGAEFIVYPGGSQGDEFDVVRRMRIGQLNAALLSAIGLAEIEPAVKSLQVMPMMFESWEEVDYVGGKTLRPILEAALKKRGYEVLFWTEAGWVQIFSNQPAITPADFRKLKVFAWTNDVDQIQIMQSMGYHPVVLTSSDIVAGLQTGLIDAAPATPMFALAVQLDQSAAYMLELNWVPFVGVAVMTTEAWESMTEPAREAIARAARDGARKLRARRLDMDTQAIDTMVKRGLTVHRMTPEVQAEWRSMVEAAYPTIRGRIVPAEMFDQVKALLSEYRSNHGD